MNYTLQDYEDFLNDEEIQDQFIDNGINSIIVGKTSTLFDVENIEPENKNCLRFSYCFRYSCDSSLVDTYSYDCILKESDSSIGEFTLKVIAYDGQDNDGNYLYIKREFKNISCDSDLFEVMCNRVYHLLWDSRWISRPLSYYKSEYIEELVINIEKEIHKIKEDIHYEFVGIPCINMLMLGEYKWNLCSDIVNIIGQNI